MFFSVYLVSFTHIHNKTMTWIGSLWNMIMCGAPAWVKEPKVCKIVVLGVIWVHLWDHNSVNFNHILKIRAVFERRYYYLKFDIKVFGEIKNFGPAIWTPTSQWKMKIKGSDKDQLLEIFFQNMQKNNDLTPRKKWTPLNEVHFEIWSCAGPLHG